MSGDLHRNSQTEQRCKNVARHQCGNGLGVAKAELGTGFVDVLEQNDRYSTGIPLLITEHLKLISTFVPTSGHPLNSINLLHPEMPLPVQTAKILLLSVYLPLCVLVHPAS